MTQLDLSNVKFPDKMDIRTAAIYLGMSEGYVRQRVSDESIKAEKVDNQWVITKASLDEFKAQPRRTGGGGRRGNGKYWLVRIKHSDLQAFKDFAKQHDTEIEPRYKSKKNAKKRVPADANAGKPATATPQPAKK